VTGELNRTMMGRVKVAQTAWKSNVSSFLSLSQDANT